MPRETNAMGLDLASPDYLGGLVDAGLFFRAEGRKVKSRRLSVPPTYHTYPQLAIFDTREALIKSIIDRFGGNKYGVNGKNGTKKVWEWSMTKAEDVEDFLKEVEGMINLKQPLAKTFLDFFNHETADFPNRLKDVAISSYDKPFLPNPMQLAGMMDLAGGMGIYQRQMENGDVKNELGFSLTTPYFGLVQALKEHYPTTNYYTSRETTRRYYGKPTFVWWAINGDTEQVTQDIAPYILFRKPLLEAMERGLSEGIETLKPELPFIQPLMKGLKRKVA